MNNIRVLVALSVAALATACASPTTGDAATSSLAGAEKHAAHDPNCHAAAPMAAMEPRMKAMQEMHQKMMNAKTPAERQALMADHMKAMQGGMAMMQGMSPMGGMGAMGAASAPMAMPGDMAKCMQSMQQRMDMMQMMMEMMMDRMPAAPPAK